VVTLTHDQFDQSVSKITPIRHLKYRIYLYIINGSASALSCNLKNTVPCPDQVNPIGFRDEVDELGRDRHYPLIVCQIASTLEPRLIK
jgi:hypothetical protein